MEYTFFKGNCNSSRNSHFFSRNLSLYLAVMNKNVSHNYKNKKKTYEIKKLQLSLKKNLFSGGNRLS